MEFQISVLISTYSNRRFVEKKLAEIQRQTLFSQSEFIFIETASPERERELIAPFCDAHPNCKLIALDERKTLYEAWNLGWDAARAPLLCYSNMDDAMHPRLLEEVVRAMKQQHWDLCSVLIAKQMMDEQWNDWSPQRLRSLPLSLRPGPFTAWRADLAGNIGRFDGRFVIAGDKDFWARAVAHRVRVGLVKRVLYLYTKGAGQMSKTDDASKWENERRLFAEKPYPPRWHNGLRWQVFWRRWVFKVFPGLYSASTH